MSVFETHATNLMFVNVKCILGLFFRFYKALDACKCLLSNS